MFGFTKVYVPAAVQIQWEFCNPYAYSEQHNIRTQPSNSKPNTTSGKCLLLTLLHSLSRKGFLLRAEVRHVAVTQSSLIGGYFCQPQRAGISYQPLSDTTSDQMTLLLLIVFLQALNILCPTVLLVQFSILSKLCYSSFLFTWESSTHQVLSCLFLILTYQAVDFPLPCKRKKKQNKASCVSATLLPARTTAAPCKTICFVLHTFRGIRWLLQAEDGVIFQDDVAEESSDVGAVPEKAGINYFHPSAATG